MSGTVPTVYAVTHYLQYVDEVHIGVTGVWMDQRAISIVEQEEEAIQQLIKPVLEQRDVFERRNKTKLVRENGQA